MVGGQPSQIYRTFSQKRCRKLNFRLLADDDDIRLSGAGRGHLLSSSLYYDIILYADDDFLPSDHNGIL